MSRFQAVIIILYVLEEREAEVLYLSVRRLQDGFKLILSLSKAVNVSIMLNELFKVIQHMVVQKSDILS